MTADGMANIVGIEVRLIDYLLGLGLFMLLLLVGK